MAGIALRGRQLDDRTRSAEDIQPHAATQGASGAGASDVGDTCDFPRLFPDIVGHSDALRTVLREVRDLASSEIPVLIEGESGTGKELIARSIHRLSARARREFVSENCGAIPEQLVESEVFGHERGAFTGARESRPGLLERAHEGTLFLDEVGEMDLSLQKRFLRVLQERSVRRLGGRAHRDVDIRVISATNRNLEQMVDRREFREDLFYRLHVGYVRLPPLRERKEDVPVLLEYFASLYAQQSARARIVFAPDAMAHLKAYRWPGNVRELGNETWRLATTVRGEVRPRHLSGRIARRVDPVNDDDGSMKSLADLEREILGEAILDVLRRTEGNVSRAARILGVGRTTLYRRIERYGLRIE